MNSDVRKMWIVSPIKHTDLCTYLAQFHFYAFNKILSALHIKMPYTSLLSGFRLACQAGVETNTLQLEEFYFSSWQG